jgi:hypothetical protein
LNCGVLEGNKLFASQQLARLNHAFSANREALLSQRIGSYLRGLKVFVRVLQTGLVFLRMYFRSISGYLTHFVVLANIYCFETDFAVRAFSTMPHDSGQWWSADAFCSYDLQHTGLFGLWMGFFV